jgi:Tfp pilus assembly protein PilN
VRELAMLAGLLILAGLSFTPYYHLPGQRRAADALDRKMRERFLAACPDALAARDPLSQIQERLRSAAGRQSGLPRRISVLDTMTAFVTALPADLQVEVTEYILTGGSLFVAGRTGDLRSLERLRSVLEASGKFRDVKVGDISFDTDRMVLFNIMAKIP